jgi:hypothetical protein
MMAVRRFLATLMRDGEMIYRKATSAQSTNSQTKCILCVFLLCAQKTHFSYVNNLLRAGALFTKMTRFAKIKHQAAEKEYTADSQNWSQIELERSRRLDFLSPKNL